MGGRLKAITCASRIAAPRVVASRIALKTDVSSVVRSSKGSIVTRAKAELDFEMPSRIEKPVTEVTLSTPGSPISISSTPLCAATVRLRDAASGRRVSTMKEPWSSEGRKPVGTARKSPPVATAARTRSATPRIARRASAPATRV